MQSWSPLQQQVFCTDILNLLCSAKHSGTLSLYRVELSTLSACFPQVLEKVFCQASSRSTSRLLKLALEDDIDTTLRMTVDNLRCSRQIIITSTCDSFRYMQRNILSQATVLNDVDEFKFDIAYDGFQLTIDTYYEILKPMKNLKKITLDISELLQDHQPVSCSGITQTYGVSHPLVETVKLTIIKWNSKCQSLLEVFSVMFPNLKWLHIDRFCGIRENNEYQVNLQKYSLESLTVDVTRVYIDMQSYDHFFIVDVDVLQNGKKYKYKVSRHDLSLVSRIHPEDLSSEEEYFHVHILIKNLQRLVLCLYMYDMEEEYLDDRIHMGSYL